MAKASQHQSGLYTKLLYVGDSGSGKTGSLLSLLQDDYELRILDLDNGLDWLVNEVRVNHPKLLDQIDYITIRDKFKTDKREGAKVVTKDMALPQLCQALDEWDDGTIPAQWGEKTILVIDSLTYLATACLNWASQFETRNNMQAVYGTAQDKFIKILDMVTSETFQTNVICCAHYEVREDDVNGTWTQVTSVGKALGKKVPAAFNNMVVAKVTGSERKKKREIYLRPVDGLSVKAATSFSEDTLPLETGMATLFRLLKGQAQ